MKMEKLKLGVSSCLLGHQVRYDGGHKYDAWIVETLGQFAEFVPVCPEAGCGLPIPREAMRLVGSKEDYRLLTNKTGIDHTDKMLAFCAPPPSPGSKRKIFVAISSRANLPPAGWNA
jgi:uncharacterized protein YbbK (DUF523 family)